MYLSLPSHPRSRYFHREASTIQPSAFLKFGVAKLGWDTRENKKMTSTANLHKPIIYNTLQDKHLYREEKEYEAIKKQHSSNLYRDDA